MKTASLLLGLGLLTALPGCVVIPVGDLLKGPPLGEQVLVEGAGFFSKEKIAIIEIDGLIEGRERSSLLWPRENTVAETKARLDRARSDDEVKAVILRIGSPGGEVTACDILHREIQRFKESTGVPVVVSITDIGASGGYYVAVAGDVIYAQPTSIVGSIGVILQNFDLSGLMEKVGVASAPVKSSSNKDLNSPFRPLTEEERAILQKLVDDMQSRFVDVVVDGRPGLKREEVLALADGRVVSGGEAASLKLVDEVGYLSDAIAEAQRLGKVESPTLVRYARIQRSGANIYTQVPLEPAAEKGFRWNVEADLPAWPRLLYVWQPGS